MTSTIKAITFDLWDTVFIDESDEPKRKAQGLLSKPEERRSLLYEALSKTGSTSIEEMNIAFNVADAAFRQVWYGQNVTWTAAERIAVILKGLDREIPEVEQNHLCKNIEEMELKIKPELAPGIKESIESLSKKYKLGVISDTIFSSGRVLKQILVEYGLAQYFESFVFSDEAGCSKPDRRVFEIAARDLGVNTSDIVHIGDREKKDIQGAHQVGAKAIYTTVVLNRGPAKKAEAICQNYRDLEKIVDQLNR